MMKLILQSETYQTIIPYHLQVAMYVQNHPHPHPNNATPSLPYSVFTFWVNFAQNWTPEGLTSFGKGESAAFAPRPRLRPTPRPRPRVGTGTGVTLLESSETSSASATRAFAFGVGGKMALALGHLLGFGFAIVLTAPFFGAIVDGKRKALAGAGT